MAINSRPRATTAVLVEQYGFCFQGCKSGAKWSTLYTEIPAAEKTGKLELRTKYSRGLASSITPKAR